MINQPLFLPKGSVRAVLIIFLTTWITLMFWFSKSIPESVLVLWASAFGWYFGGKNNQQN